MVDDKKREGDSSLSLSVNKHDEKSPQGPEVPSLFNVAVVSAGALSAGFAGGVWYQFRKAKFKFNFQEHHNELRFAGKALLAGTALCLGSFGALASVFIYATGVTSFLEFSYLMKSTFQGRKVDGPSEEYIRETQILKGMTKDQEWDYWRKKFGHYFDGDDSSMKVSVNVEEALKEIDDKEEQPNHK